jgi:hypothetical protein
MHLSAWIHHPSIHPSWCTAGCWWAFLEELGANWLGWKDHPSICPGTLVVVASLWPLAITMCQALLSSWEGPFFFCSGLMVHLKNCGQYISGLEAWFEMKLLY